MLAFIGQGVQFGAFEPFKRGDEIGANALMRLRNPAAQFQIAGIQHELARERPGVRHLLHTAGHDHVLRAGLHTHRSQRERRQPRTAEPIQRKAGYGEREAGIQRRHPG